jgi:hypothetical protein
MTTLAHAASAHTYYGLPHCYFYSRILIVRYNRKYPVHAEKIVKLESDTEAKYGAFVAAFDFFTCNLFDSRFAEGIGHGVLPLYLADIARRVRGTFLGFFAPFCSISLVRICFVPPCGRISNFGFGI